MMARVYPAWTIANKTNGVIVGRKPFAGVAPARDTILLTASASSIRMKGS
jgi:hypothetical protein